MNTREEFYAKVEVQGECWVWTGARHPGGYGRVWWEGRTRPAHRVSLELEGIEIPEGHHVDHLCVNPPCIRPSHLEPVTPTENTKRARKWWHKFTACPNGHPYDTTDADGRRRCRECRAAQRRALYAKRKGTIQ